MQKKIIALTGGIGSGKSTVSALLRQKGYCVIDCDELSRRVASNRDALDEISRIFGERYVIDGALDRRALAQEVFSDEKKTRTLNEIFHKRVFDMLTEEISKQDGTIFVEIQVLPCEKHDFFDEVWVVTADETIRIKRASARDGRSEEQIKNIIERQKSVNEKLHPNTHTIKNEGDMSALQTAVDTLLKRQNIS